MSTTVWYETHSTTTDNESGTATGWLPGELSEVGRDQADDLGERIIRRRPAAIFASDLARATQTVAIALNRSRQAEVNPPVLLDWRLRECNYGRLNGAPSARVHADRTVHLTDPYPDGESWSQAVGRVWSSVHDAVRQFEGETIMIVGHIATGLAIQALAERRPVAELIIAPFEWQPGWIYNLSAD